MRKFQDAYREEVNRLPGIRMDAQSVGDEIHHRHMERKRRQKRLMQAAAAAVLFMLCGVGTATAVNYQKSIFEVTENGFTAVSEKAQVPKEREGSALPASVENTSPVPFMETASGEEGLEEAEGIAECEVVEYKPVEYTSIEEFQEKEAVSIAIPDKSLLGEEEPVSERVIFYVETGRVMVSVNFEDSHFHMSQWDHRGVEGYASSTAFMGESANERHFISEQGLDYTMFDIMEEGEITSTHAIISVNGRDLTFDFTGYDKERIETILNQLDLSIYFKDE